MLLCMNLAVSNIIETLASMLTSFGLSCPLPESIAELVPELFNSWGSNVWLCRPLLLLEKRFNKCNEFVTADERTAHVHTCEQTTCLCIYLRWREICWMTRIAVSLRKDSPFLCNICPANLLGEPLPYFFVFVHARVVEGVEETDKLELRLDDLKDPV